MCPNYTKAFLNLEGVFIKKVIQADSFIKTFIQSQPVEWTYPCHGAKTKRVRDYRLREIQDIPLLGKQVIPLLRRRRYLCPYCCGQFTEPHSSLSSYHHEICRPTLYVVSLLRQIFSLKQIAELAGVSIQMVYHLLDTIYYPPPDQLPRALSIDEFKSSASTGKYQCILVDLKERRALDILPDRIQNHLADYWRNTPRKERLKVEFFVCDVWCPYTGPTQTFFPNAAITMDRYHFIWQMTWVIENVHKRLQRSTSVSLCKYYKRSRKLILVRYKKLKDESKRVCDLILHYSEDLRLAHHTGEWLYDVCQIEAYCQQRREFDD